MKKHYTIDPNLKWDYENGFYLTCEQGRLGKLFNQIEIYKKILHLPGDVLEFGVYKGASLMRLMSFRHFFESEESRKIIGFDIFGKFPDQLQHDIDKRFVDWFENEGGLGIHHDTLEELIKAKNISNFELVPGDINVTAIEFAKSHPAQKIALLHIDVDVYEPTKVILETFWDSIVSGGIIMLDDYAYEFGETKAVDEFFKEKNIKIEKPPYNFIPTYIVKP
jgi:hypothetical protein